MSVWKALIAATLMLTAQTLLEVSSARAVLATPEMASYLAMVMFIGISELLITTTLLTDIDECLLGNFICEVNTDCVNTVGDYDCVCSPGYTGFRNNCMSK